MDLATPRLFRWDDLPRESVTDKLDRHFVTGTNVMAAHIRLAKGCVVPLHSHEAEQFSWIFTGALKFVIGGETIVVGPGEVLTIPSWVEHEAVALEDTYEMDVFSPIRHDWLQKTDGYFHDAPTRPLDFSNPATGGNPARVTRWSEVTSEQLTDFIERRFLMGERATVASLHLKKGCVVPTHSHESEQLTWVQKGVLDLVLDGKTFRIEAGSVLRIPAWLPHSATAVEAVEVIDLFGPRREDWLAKTDAYLRQGNR